MLTRALLETPIIAHLGKKSTAFIETEDSLPYSKQLSTEP
jgi:hypothetical protein